MSTNERYEQLLADTLAHVAAVTPPEGWTVSTTVPRFVDVVAPDGRLVVVHHDGDEWWVRLNGYSSLTAAVAAVVGDARR